MEAIYRSFPLPYCSLGNAQFTREGRRPRSHSIILSHQPLSTHSHSSSDAPRVCLLLQLLSQHKRWQQESAVIHFAYFPSDELPSYAFTGNHCKAAASSKISHQAKNVILDIWDRVPLLSLCSALALCTGQGHAAPSHSPTPF